MPTDARIREWEQRLRAGGTIKASEPEYDASVLEALQHVIRGAAPVSKPALPTPSVNASQPTPLAAVQAEARTAAVLSGASGQSAAETAIQREAERRGKHGN
jgi:hypothetical protein